MSVVASSTLTLKKREKLSLSKPGLNKVRVAITWRDVGGESIDLDLSAFMLNDKGLVTTEQDFIFYRQEISPEGSVAYQGDNKKGSKAGDDGSLGDSEAIDVDLMKVPPRIQRIAFTVTIDQAIAKRHSFKHAADAVARLYNAETGAEIARFPLEDDFKDDISMIMVELVRQGNSWDFTPVGQGFKGQLDAVCRNYGLEIGYD